MKKFKIISFLTITILAGILSLTPVFIRNSPAEELSAGMDLYFVRHAETMANATGQYTEEYARTFTKKGKKQIDDLTEMLGEYKFDFICVSPKLRTLNTILPYLKKHNLSAEIWPELEECCWQTERDVQPSAKFMRGKKIVLNDEMKRYFRFREPGMNYFYKGGNYADGVLRIKKAYDLLIERFGGSGKSILVVGHSLAGGRMIEILMGLEPSGICYPHNAALFHLREEADGKFKMMKSNLASPGNP